MKNILLLLPMIALIAIQFFWIRNNWMVWDDEYKHQKPSVRETFAIMWITRDPITFFAIALLVMASLSFIFEN